MTPSGCDRICARCDHLVHDLSHYTFDEAEALLRADPGTCVRAAIDADGVVALKPGREGRVRRMVIAAAATAGLLTASAPAYARQERPGGAIAGNIQSYGERIRVTATDTSGRTFRVRAKSNGRFRIRHVPAGTYTLTFDPDCGSSWTVENVVVREAETNLPGVESPDQCVVIGLLRIEDSNG
jgi:hypothetical protein